VPTNRCADEHDALGWFDAEGACGLALAHTSYVDLIADVLGTIIRG
jgi:hypothetical protein